MSDDIKTSGGFDRRRFIKGAGAGVAIAWTAPIITGMNARAFAAGSPTACLDQFSDNFDGEGSAGAFGPGYDTVTTLLNFNVTGGNIDIIGSGPFGGGFDFFPGNGYYLDLSGTNSGGGSESGISILTSKQTFCRGSYRVTIRYAGDQRNNGNNSFVATLGDGSTGVLAPVPSSPILTASFNGDIPAGGGNLVITHNSGGADNQGVLLLEVTVASI